MSGAIYKKVKSYISTKLASTVLEYQFVFAPSFLSNWHTLTVNFMVTHKISKLILTSSKHNKDKLAINVIHSVLAFGCEPAFGSSAFPPFSEVFA